MQGRAAGSVALSGRLQRRCRSAALAGVTSSEISPSTRSRPVGRRELPARAANLVRDTLEHGARVLSDRERPLFLGFVLGDTRGQAPEVTDDFNGSGLTHLLAVSGENVAFVLALAGPVLRRLTLRPRFLATISVIAFFALITRFEPSVLRASVMAALAVTATMLGREASQAPTARVLAVARYGDGSVPRAHGRLPTVGRGVAGHRVAGAAVGACFPGRVPSPMRSR